MASSGIDRRVDWIERAALSASALCLAHCIALPLLIAALPLLASVLRTPETVHLWLLLFAIPSSAIALGIGRRQHLGLAPVMLGGLGLACLALGALRFAATPWETPVTVCGSLSLAAAHYLNWRLRHARHRRA